MTVAEQMLTTHPRAGAGADTAALQEIAELLDADWLPATALSES